jgi:hypothetical protein
VNAVLLERSDAVPARFRDQIDQGMMIDAIQHEYRFQQRIHDQKYLPTTFEHHRFEFDSPIRKVLPRGQAK